MKKNYSINITIERRTFWTILVPIAVLLTLTGIMTGILIVDRLIMPRMIHVNRGVVTVPAITDLGFEDARQKLYDIGLRMQITSKDYSDAIPRDHVITQEPAPGEKLNTAERRGVQVVISKGPEIITMPSIENMQEFQARRELIRLGLTVGKIARKFSDEVPKDGIISSSPKAGTSISREMPVDLVISKGPEPTTTEVPTLVGEMLSTAKKSIEEAGLKVGKIETRPSSSAAPGSIISQSESPGSSVPFGTAINLVVSTQK
jgi:serine/threonine-protein kinase